ncbi:ROK family transcriptional regulator [Devosia rhizoryzae]|nr:ROK family transcriptional regulator [Devosia rhizoryzae]
MIDALQSSARQREFDADAITLLEALRRGPRSRAELANTIGWSRNTVAAKLASLIDAGWVIEINDSQGDRGRPFTRYGLNPVATHIFVARFDAESVTAALTQLNGNVLDWEQRDLPQAQGPETAIRTLDEMLEAICGRTGISRYQIGATIVGVPGPVSEMRRTVPWSKVGVLPADLAAHFGMKVAVENDANIMALGVQLEHPEAESVLFLLVETGIGAGLVFGGHLHRGFGGWAGEVGHIPVAAGGNIPCICGNRGCLANVASNPVLLRSISTPERPLNTVEDLRAAVIDGDTAAIVALREAGRHIGEAITGLVVGLAPDIISVGGNIAQVGDHVIAGIRETLSTRTPPAISSHLRIMGAPEHNRTGVKGATELALDLLFQL